MSSRQPEMLDIELMPHPAEQSCLQRKCCRRQQQRWSRCRQRKVYNLPDLRLCVAEGRILDFRDLWLLYCLEVFADLQTLVNMHYFGCTIRKLASTAGILCMQIKEKN